MTQSTNTFSNIEYLEIAREVFCNEAAALQTVSDKLDANFASVVRRLIESKGRVIVSGMGKSGIIGKKIAATLASTGTPSFFMHPGEAYHGDLGMVTPEDSFLAISNSGETDEMVKLIPFLKDNRNLLIGLTGNSASTMARNSDYHLDIGVESEACPLRLAPTSSTTATLAMGDALAVTLMQARGFKQENFARFHPGGFLGRRLLARVEDEMVRDNLPLVSPQADIIAVIQAMSRGRLGIAIVDHEKGYGIITDGDIRRAVEKYGESLFKYSALDLMSPNAQQIAKSTRVEDALTLMDKKAITTLLVVDQSKLCGVFKK